MIFVRDGCVNCPAAEAVVEEVMQEESCKAIVEKINADNISEKLMYELLENSLFIFAVPTVILEEDGKMTLISSGEPPTKEMLIKCVGD